MEKITFVDNVTKANAETFNTMQDNIEDAIDEIGVYSTNEEKVGIWTDGKPVYRKVINAGTISSSGANIGTITNIDNLISIKGTAYSSQFNQRYGIPNTHSDNSTYYINLLMTGTNVTIRFGSGITSLEKVIVILEYTKTID